MCVFVRVSVKGRTIVCECVPTALGCTVGDNKEPWQTPTLTTIYNLNSSRMLYVSATCRALTLASIIDRTGGLELTGTDLWISNSNVSQISIGFFTPLRPHQRWVRSVFVPRDWNWNSDMQCGITLGIYILLLFLFFFFANSRMSAKYSVQLREKKSVFHILHYILYIRTGLSIGAGPEDNRCSTPPEGNKVFPHKRFHKYWQDLH